MPPGQYTAKAVVIDPPMTGSVEAKVRAGEKTQVSITLKPGVVSAIAKMFIVHFRFDNAFVEPCMREVLKEVAGHASDHSDEKLVVVGHTDEVGSPSDLTASDPYNQSLSERRARSAFALLTFGLDANASKAEWNALRQKQTGLTTLGDKWGTRQYQYILQDLGFYSGNVDGDHGPATDAAVRAFQQDKGLTVDGIVADQTWAALIEAYLSQDALAVPSSQFLPNKALPTDPPCEDGILKWLGCASQDPVKNIREAWRPNRRVELLFVRTDKFPCQQPQPDTFDLPTPGTVNAKWCLKPGNKSNRACFVVPHLPPGGQPKKEEWVRQPAEPGPVTVRGSIKFEDGTPAANVKYILIAPDGEFMDGEVPKGERRGEPILGKTKKDGTFEYADKPKDIGICTLEIQGPFVARLKGEPVEKAKGNVVCARLDGTSDFDVIVVGAAVFKVKPSITLASPIVVVKKPHTNPARQGVTLKADPAFTGSGAFTRSNDNIHFFTATVGGTEITFNGTDNVFTDTQLIAGQTIFAEGFRASTATDDVELKLALTVNGQIALAATAKMTSVELTLDICQGRTSPTLEPAPLATNDKINTGRFLQAQNVRNLAARAKLIVRRTQPADFAGELELNPINGQTQVFKDEIPAPGQVPLPVQVIANNTITPDGVPLFAQGVTVSAAVRDTGFRLGIRNLEPDGDRVAITIVQIDAVTTSTATAPAATATRIGLWDNAFRADGTVFNDEAAVNNFVGADSRQFFIRVRDASQIGVKPINVEWRALAENDDDFHAPIDKKLTLVESAADPGVFISRALMLVTDDDDHQQGTHSGLPAGLPDAGIVRARDQSNHRLRRASIRGSVIAQYAHPLALTSVMVEKLPVFERTPDDRRRLQLQIFVLRVAPAGKGVVLTAPGSQIWTRDIRVAEECYARFGIEVKTVVAPGTPAADIQEERPFIQNETVLITGPRAFTLLRNPVVKDARNTITVQSGGGGAQAFKILYDDDPNAPGSKEVKVDRATGRLTFKADEQPKGQDKVVASYVAVGHRVVLINSPAGVNPLAVRFQPTNDETTIGAAFPGLPNTVRVFYTGGLPTQGNRGESWPDVDFAGQAQVGSSFINGATYGPYTVAHEVGHLLTNKTGAANTGHYVQPAAPAGNRLFTNQNLMRNGTSPAEGVNQSKRFWDAADTDGVNQFAQIRGVNQSRFIRPF